MFSTLSHGLLVSDSVELHVRIVKVSRNFPLVNKQIVPNEEGKRRMKAKENSIKLLALKIISSNLFYNNFLLIINAHFDGASRMKKFLHPPTMSGQTRA